MSRFIMPRQGIKGQNFTPADGAKLHFKVIGQGVGGTNKAVFTDEALTIAATNPVIADSVGLFEELWHDGDYDTFLTDKNNIPKWGPETIRDLAQATDDKLTPLTVSIMVNDARFSSNDAGKSVPITAEFSTGDGGSGTYDVVLTSSVTPNTFDIIISDADATISFVLRIKNSMEVEAFRVLGDDDGTGTTGTDNTAAMQRAVIACRHLTATGGKFYRFDGEYYIPKRRTVDWQEAIPVYTGTGTGIGQTTAWTSGSSVGPVAGVTLGEETGGTQQQIKFINFKMNIVDKDATGIVLYGATGCTVDGLIEGLFQPFDNTRTSLGLRVRGSAGASNWGNIGLSSLFC